MSACWVTCVWCWCLLVAERRQVITRRLLCSQSVCVAAQEEAEVQPLRLAAAAAGGTRAAHYCVAGILLAGRVSLLPPGPVIQAVICSLLWLSASHMPLPCWLQVSDTNGNIIRFEP